VRGENLDALGVACRPRRAVVALRQRGGDLRPIAARCISQDEADVGMSNHAALTVDDIGATSASHVDAGDDVPDVLEIDRGESDVTRLAGRHRQPDRRFGLADEKHRAIPGALASRSEEFRRRPPVRAGARSIGGGARDRRHLPTRRIDQRQLAHGRRVAHHTNGVYPPIFIVAGQPWRRYEKPKSTFRVLQEVADAFAGHSDAQDLRVGHELTLLAPRDPTRGDPARDQNGGGGEEHERCVLEQ